MELFTYMTHLWISNKGLSKSATRNQCLVGIHCDWISLYFHRFLLQRTDRVELMMPLTWQGLFVIYSYSWFVTNPQSNINITNSWNEGVGSFGYGNSNTLLQMCISPSPTATSPQGRFSLADNLYIYSCPDLSTTPPLYNGQFLLSPRWLLRRKTFNGMKLALPLEDYFRQNV